jgi:hypothetical protein
LGRSRGASVMVPAVAAATSVVMLICFRFLSFSHAKQPVASAARHETHPRK